MNFSEGRKILAESTGRALGSVLSEIKLCPDLSFSTFTKLYNPLVGSVLFYAAGVWGFDEALDCNSVQSRALRRYLGVHIYTAKAAIEGDVAWEPCLVKQRCEIVHPWNRLVCLPEERLTRNVFNWDRANNFPWSREVSVILSAFDSHMMLRNNLQCNISFVKEMFVNYKDL